MCHDGSATIDMLLHPFVHHMAVALGMCQKRNAGD